MFTLKFQAYISNWLFNIRVWWCAYPSQRVPELLFRTSPQALCPLNISKIFTLPVVQGKDLEIIHHNFSHSLYSICQESLMTLPSRFIIYPEHDHFPPNVSAGLLIVQDLILILKAKFHFQCIRGGEMAPSVECMAYSMRTSSCQHQYKKLPVSVCIGNPSAEKDRRIPMASWTVNIVNQWPVGFSERCCLRCDWGNWNSCA